MKACSDSAANVDSAGRLFPKRNTATIGAFEAARTGHVWVAATLRTDLEGRAALRGILEGVHRASDIGAAPEEHGRMLRAESGKPAEWRALGRDRPDHGSALEHVFVELTAQESFELRLELIGISEFLIAGLEMTLASFDEALPEGLQAIELLVHQRPALLILDGEHGRRRLAEEIDVRPPLAFDCSMAVSTS
jgi:hypothetical protein